MCSANTALSTQCTGRRSTERLGSNPVALLQLERQVHLAEVLEPERAQRLDLGLHLAQRMQMMRQSVICQRGHVLSENEGGSRNAIYGTLG